VAESTLVRTKRDVQMLIYDLGAVHTYTPAWQPGDLSWAGGEYEIVSSLDKGDFTATPSLRKGNELPLTGSFTVYLRDVGDTANAYTTMLELCSPYTGRYVAANWVSTLGANADVFTVSFAITIDGSFAGEADKTLTATFVVLRLGGVQSGDPSTQAVNWTSHQSRFTLS
jgi:hypothetical protein